MPDWALSPADAAIQAAVRQVANNFDPYVINPPVLPDSSTPALSYESARDAQYSHVLSQQLSWRLYFHHLLSQIWLSWLLIALPLWRLSADQGDAADVEQRSLQLRLLHAIFVTSLIQGVLSWMLLHKALPFLMLLQFRSLVWQCAVLDKLAVVSQGYLVVCQKLGMLTDQEQKQLVGWQQWCRFLWLWESWYGTFRPSLLVYINGFSSALDDLNHQVMQRAALALSCASPGKQMATDCGILSGLFAMRLVGAGSAAIKKVELFWSQDLSLSQGDPMAHQFLVVNRMEGDKHDPRAWPAETKIVCLWYALSHGVPACHSKKDFCASGFFARYPQLKSNRNTHVDVLYDASKEPPCAPKMQDAIRFFTRSVTERRVDHASGRKIVKVV